MNLSHPPSNSKIRYLAGGAVVVVVFVLAVLSGMWCFKFHDLEPSLHPLQWKLKSLNHWVTREVLGVHVLE